MKKENRQILTKQIVIFVIVICLFLAGKFYFGGIDKEKSDEQKRLNNEVSALKRNLENEKKDYAEFLKRYDLEYLKIDEGTRPNQLNSTNERSRIKVITPVMNLLSADLDLYNPSLKFSGSRRVNDNSGNFVMVISDVEVSFSAKADSFVYSFISGIVNNNKIPGFVRLKKLKIEQIQSFDSRFVRNLERSKVLNPLIKANIVFSWVVVEDNKNVLAGGKE